MFSGQPPPKIIPKWKRLLLSLLLAAASALHAADVARPFPALLDSYYEDYLALFPIDVAINGDNDPRYETVWPNDISPEYRGR